MINIKSKFDCCGCNACVQACPKQCIVMSEDYEGFLYPEVNKELCINCDLCEKVCPVSNQVANRFPMEIYAVINENKKVCLESSSGGVFTSFAEKVINENGLVFGAKFDSNWEVVHDHVDTCSDLSVFRGSKYLQSRIENTFLEVRFFLNKGRKVLYSGTPCQIAGLKRFLNKDYENLLTVDFVCHGVPSPKIWRSYLKQTIERRCGKQIDSVSIETISFRNKCLSWKKFSFALTFSITDDAGILKIISFSEIFSKNLFMKGFLSNLYLRPSCYACPAKKLKSGSDITIGDFWGIKKVSPDFYNDKGVSLVLINSDKGYKYFKELNVTKQKSCYDDVLKGNSFIVESAHQPAERETFFREFLKGKDVESLVNDLTLSSIMEIIKKITLRIKNYIVK